MIEYIIYSLFFIYIIAVAFIDIKTMKIPNKFNLIGFIIGLLSLCFNSFISFQSALLGMLFGFFTLLIITIITGGGFGAGDIKYISVIGLFMGLRYTFYILLLAAWLHTIYLLLRKKKSGAFGPALSIGSFVCTIILFISQYK